MPSLRQFLLSPRSVAIVGQSNDPTKAAGRPLKFLRQAGYAGRVFPVNARRDEVLLEPGRRLGFTEIALLATVGRPRVRVFRKPEVAILGLGRGRMKAVVRENSIQPRLMVPVALSYDHRVIDGAAAARFIVDLVKSFEEFKEDELKKALK